MTATTSTALATHSKRQSAKRQPQAAHSSRDLTRPARRHRSLGDVGTVLTICLFVGCLFLAVLHAVLVQNQAHLDNLIEENQLRQERVDQLLAEIAYLDSPEGVAENALKAGLLPAAEVVTLAPLGAGELPAPSPDPFGLAGLPPINTLTPPGLSQAATTSDPKTIEDPLADTIIATTSPIASAGEVSR